MSDFGDDLPRWTADPRFAPALACVREAWAADGRAVDDFDALAATYPLGREALAHLLCVSPISLEKMRREPALFAWLARPTICGGDRGPKRFLAELTELRAGREDFDAQLVALRRLHRRELLRIAQREVAGVATLAQTTRELSALAGVLLQEALRGWQADCARRWSGAPATGFAILGLGKLGGRDLNFSSDVDLMFLYGEDGAFRANFSHLEYFTRLGERLTSSFARTDPAGSLFRLDLRLRPEGDGGPLVVSLNAAENYYAGHGETWERMMLAKARHVAGDQEVTYEFIQRLQPFVYPRSLAPDTLTEIGELKERIEREHGGADIGAPLGNVKLGRGGIREIEFIAGALQLLHGARQAFLQETSTLTVLEALARLEFLPTAEFEALAEAYEFLRRVEHRLQIAEEAQTHTLPATAAENDLLARSLGLPDAPALYSVLEYHTAVVRGIFQRIIGSGDGQRPRRSVPDIFTDPASAAKALERLAEGPAGMHAAARSRKLSSRLEPLLLERLAEAADPDGALTRFLRFVEGYGIRGLLLEMLLMHPRLLDLLVRLFDASGYFAGVLTQRPAWLEELLSHIGLDEARDTERELAWLRGHADDLNALRVQQQGMLLRIVLREVLGLCGSEPPFAEISALAEASVIRACELLELTERVTVVAFGKLGGAELGYGADLDVVLIGSDNAAAEKLTRSLAQNVQAGGLFPLDIRLRPEGVNGPLVCSLAQYGDYFRGGRAQAWEVQALTKARPICGPDSDGFRQLARSVWGEMRQRGDARGQVAAMLQRVQRERSQAGAEALEFKTGPGGIVAAEFVVQALQLERGVREPHTLTALAELEARDAIAPGEAEALRHGYRLLRRVESALRRQENRSVSQLPADEGAQRRLARWLRLGEAAALREALARARGDIRRVAATALHLDSAP
ncbi:MAG: hypothetical protein JSR82_22580 [Verrucomicrobia bacterium]|nr:hypothetical protein [Verrucomicrobiota bacterium]